MAKGATEARGSFFFFEVSPLFLPFFLFVVERLECPPSALFLNQKEEEEEDARSTPIFLPLTLLPNENERAREKEKTLRKNLQPFFCVVFSPLFPLFTFCFVSFSRVMCVTF